MHIFSKKWSLIFALVLVGFISNDSNAQCKTQNYIDYMLRNIPNGYNFLKSYPLDGKGGIKKSIEYSFIFSRNTNYTISLANHKNVKVEIFDSNRKLKGTSSHNGKNYSGFTYKCPATGLYYLKFTFNNSAREFCSAALLSFKK